jgi:hypothetical protein
MKTTTPIQQEAPMLPLAQQTPQQIDTALAAIHERLDRALANLDSAQAHLAWELKRQEKAQDPTAVWSVRVVAEATATIKRAKAAVAALVAEAEPFDAEYLRRGWKRYFLVLNGNGHVHRGRHCTTCFPTTRYGWLPALSGCDEKVMVAEYGEQACTVCFPDAPSLYQALKAQGLLPRTEVEAQAKRAALAAKRAAAAAKKAAAAIANPDGSPLKGANWRIDTLFTAQREIVDAYRTVASMEARQNRNEYYQQNLAAIERIAAAIAHKTGQDVAAVKAQAEAKARK